MENEQTEEQKPGAAPRAFDRQSNKPVATEREVNLTAHVAGAEAAKEVRENPSDTEGKALIGAGAHEGIGQTIGGLDLQPLSIGIHYVLDALGSRYTAQGDGSPMAITLNEIVWAAYAFARSERAFELIVEREDFATFDQEARKFSLKLNRHSLPELNEYVNREFALLEATAKKPGPLAQGPSQPAETPETASSASPPSAC